MQIDKMDKVDRPVFERRKMALELRSAARGGQRVLALEGATSRSARTRCCSTSSSSITRGERVGVVGPNGAGKTVLARVLAGELEPRERHALGRAEHRGRLPLAGGRRHAAATRR